jgi:O-succinylbenzoate synthase
MFKVRYKKHTLQFKKPSGTSRGVLTEKDTYYIFLSREEDHHCIGIGECSTIKGLSIDARTHYEEKIKEVCADINVYIANPQKELFEWPSICFGLETALKDLDNGGKRILFPSPFTEGKAGISINGLIWMADALTMRKELDEKLKAGFKCIKIKVGNLEFENELILLEEIRKSYPADSLEIRLDANGAFKPVDALHKLEQLAKFDIHSIEQPIRQGRWTEMEVICRESPIPIALDEELIGVYEKADKEMLLSYIRPQYLIFKPSLLGGFSACNEWIEIAEKFEIKWWVTSALESNIGLNAIAQWVYTLKNELPQGLGTGQLYINNVPSPLAIEDAKLWYKGEEWNINLIS